MAASSSQMAHVRFWHITFEDFSPAFRSTPMAHFFVDLFADRNVFRDVDTIITQVPGLSPARARGARLLDPIRGIFA